MNNSHLNCMKCNSELETGNRFCSNCGSSIRLQESLSRKKIKVSWRWVLFAVVSIFIFEYISAAIVSQLFVLVSGKTSLELETSILVSSIGSLAGIFLGTLYSAYMSHGISIKEPMIGAFIEILTSQLILLIISGTFTYLFIVRILIIMTIGTAGAKTGDMLQKRILGIK